MEKRTAVRLTLDQGLAVMRDLQPDRTSATLSRIVGAPQACLLKRSVDARRKSDVHFVANVGLGALKAPVPLAQREVPRAHLPKDRPVVVGMGPAGLFAALELAEAGMCPLVIERGASVQQRHEDVEGFQRTRVLDTESNVQFGEGGAGTFSDGKLTTGKNSPLVTQVLETFVAAGAPSDILWQGKPHIGTDVLGGVVSAMRERIIACGGEVRFHTRLIDVIIGRGSVRGLVVEDADGDVRELMATQVILALGHSARDSFELLHRRGFAMEPKPFSIGARIEHAQPVIDRAQYGGAAGHPALGAADYKLAWHPQDGRGVYTFCMCPGGEVVAASSEEGGLCVNGMSRQARDGANANSAILVSVTPQDFPSPEDPLSGIAFQRSWERAAYEAGGSDWSAPVQTVGSFLGASPHAAPSVKPSYPLGVREAALASCLPAFAVDALQQALPVFDRRLRGFADVGAVLTGIEARSSSPVRVLRDPSTLQAAGTHGAYPCGEGAGYAGGIMSAAIDGIRCARALMVSAASGGDA